MRRIQTLLLLIFAIGLSACTSVVVHSGAPEFASSIGEKTVKTDILFCRKDKIDSEQQGEIKNRALIANERDQCIEEFSQTLATLKNGTKVNILSIEEHKHLNLYKFEHWYYIGEVVVDGVNQKFYYYYALTITSPSKPERPEPLLWN